MRISRSWLEDYVSLDGFSAEEFSELVTTRVAEVDALEEAASPLAHAVVAAVTKVEAHPKKDALAIATLSVGAEEVQVICGAPNCREGMLSVYVPPGGVFRGPGEDFVSVDVRSIGGVEGRGVLVSERELGLSGDHSGIIELTPDYLASCRRSGAADSAKPGEPFSTIVGGPDTILEIDNKSLTHRPDLWCHYGFVREIAAILNRPIADKMDRFADDTEAGRELLKTLGEGKSDWAIEIAKDCGCYRFSAVELEHVRPLASPLWLRRRLYAVGAGVRNLIVDLSNYVMLDIGQPNHTYDADLLQGSTVVIRLAEDGEAFDGLNDESYTLSAEDMVVADDGGVIGLGGVLGGARTAVQDSTSRLLYEAASWNPVRVRKTSVRHAVRTDASNRFEKSLSAFAAPLAQHRYLQLLTELAPGMQLRGSLVDAFPEPPVRVTVPARFGYIRQRLGSDVGDAEIKRMLSALGCSWIGEEEVEVPYYRATRDLNIEDDLVEEVGRTVGYENISEDAPKITSVAAPYRHVQEYEHDIRDVLCGMGFSETYHYSFMDPEDAEALGYALEEAVELRNPVDANHSLVRTTLVPGMIEAMQQNARYAEQMLMFELGRGYERTQDPRHAILKHKAKLERTPAFERRLLTMLYSSGEIEEQLAGTVSPPLPKGADFFALLEAVRRAARKAHGMLQVRALTPAACGSENTAAAAAASPAGDYSSYKCWMHPYRAATLIVGEAEVGVIAELAPAYAGSRGRRSVISEIDVELLLEAGKGQEQFRRPSKFPPSLFEMSIVAPSSTHYSAIEALLRRSVDSSLLRQIDVIAVYEGAPLEEGQKSVSVKLHFGAEDRTLSGGEVEALQAQLVSAIESSDFSLRA